MMVDFWNTDTEKRFFIEAMKNFASPEQLFYKLKDGYFAYAPKGKTTEGQTIQGRNSLIGHFTEKWTSDFLQPIANQLGLFAVNNVVCPELGLARTTDADVAFCTTDSIQQPAENIKLIFEVKMSVVNNYRYEKTNNTVNFIGNCNSHKGNPSILRSDSMLKAIGKSINIRVSGTESTKVPIVVIGNTPITESYKKKVDFLKQAGIIQGFISLYPEPYENCVRETKGKGFQTFDNYKDLQFFLQELVSSDMNFFSSMIPKKNLGQIISISAKENSDTERAEKFLELLKNKHI